MEFNVRLGELIEDNYSSKKEFIEKVEFLNAKNLGRWLNNEVKPSCKIFTQLADLFNCSMEYLLGRTEEIGTGKYNNIKPFDVQLKKIMKEKNISQYKMNNDGVSNPSHFNKWFKLKSEPQIETIIKLADYFGVTVDYMLGRE